LIWCVADIRIRLRRWLLRGLLLLRRLRWRVRGRLRGLLWLGRRGEALCGIARAEERWLRRGRWCGRQGMLRRDVGQGLGGDAAGRGERLSQGRGAGGHR
jgi:hypothetical protein